MMPQPMRVPVLYELRKQGNEELNSRLEFYVKFFQGSLLADCIKHVLVERTVSNRASQPR